MECSPRLGTASSMTYRWWHVHRLRSSAQSPSEQVVHPSLSMTNYVRFFTEWLLNVSEQKISIVNVKCQSPCSECFIDTNHRLNIYCEMFLSLRNSLLTFGDSLFVLFKAMRVQGSVSQGTLWSVLSARRHASMLSSSWRRRIVRITLMMSPRFLFRTRTLRASTRLT